MRSTATRTLRGIVMVLLVLGLAFPAFSTTVIDTTIGWGGQAVYSWGEPGSATVGQTFKVGADNRLDSFTFFVADALNPDAVEFAAYVTTWIGYRAAGTVLFESQPLSTTNNGGQDGYEAITVETGGLILSPANHYVVFLSASDFFDGSTGLASVGYAGDVYPDGKFAYIDNGADFAALTSQEWVRDYPSLGGDLAVIMNFNVPEPATLVLDIKPGSDPNSVNLKSMGLLPVVAYGSEELDLTEIDLETLLLNGVEPRLMPDGSWHVSFEDVDGDLLLDLVMHLEMQALGIEPGMTELALTGALMDGTELQGADAIRIVPDFNGDLMVNATDLAIMKHSYGTAGVGFELGDANADGLVDATDLALLRLDLGWSESAFGEPIPEPATLSLLALGGLATLVRRRK